MRKPIIAGNWKMNKTVEEGVALAESIKPLVGRDDVEVCLCVPFVSLQAVGKAIEGSDIKLGAQNMHQKDSGAYTGEVSPLMLKSLDVDYVILGHSERREYFGETDESINEKIFTAFRNDLTPIVCCGESLEVRKAGEEKDFVKKQLVRDFKDVSAEDMKRIVVAYEPIWAIGTGETATSDQAEEMCGFIRGLIAELYDWETAGAVRIQYGGSVKPGNVDELMARENIDGALVGGASLKAEDFARLVNFE